MKGQKTEVGRPETEDRRWKSKEGRSKTEVGRRKSEDRRPKTGDGSPKSEVSWNKDLHTSFCGLPSLVLN